MKVTVCEINARQLDAEWQRLRAHIAAAAPDLLLLPEMCFAPWFCAAPARDESLWAAAARAHERWLARLPELGVEFIVGTAPRAVAGKRLNCAYLWDQGKQGEALRWIHDKTYLPNDEGYWEANWYERAPVAFQPAQAGALRLGVMICTELWFMQHARAYGKEGIHLLLNPRSTPRGTNAKWLAGGRCAAVIAGAYCLSSNHAGAEGALELGGCGWVCEPDGAVIATTSAEQPFITVEIEPALAERAKRSYPRYVDDSPL